MKDMQRDGYFTGWQYRDVNDTAKGSYRIYYNDIDIATGNLLCDGVVVGNANRVDRRMNIIDKNNNYMW